VYPGKKVENLDRLFLPLHRPLARPIGPGDEVDGCLVTPKVREYWMGGVVIAADERCAHSWLTFGATTCGGFWKGSGDGLAAYPRKRSDVRYDRLWFSVAEMPL